jgi:hypothetical protein
MENAYSSIFTLGWIDIFNPVALSMVLILLPLVRKHWHVLIYVFGAYVAYVSASVAIFFGVDRYLITFFTWLTQKYSVAVGISLLIVGIAALTGCFLMILSLVKAIKQKREITFEKVLFIKSVAPWLFCCFHSDQHGVVYFLLLPCLLLSVYSLLMKSKWFRQ